MTKKIMAMFPGQGSQIVGMAKDFYENFPAAKKRFEEANEVLGFSLTKLCFEGPQEELTKTAFTQPAILTASVVAFEAYVEKFGSENIIAGLGHSLGEYSALVASQAMLFSDAVLLVHNRGKFIQEAVPSGLGKMAAVLAKEEEEIVSQIEKLGLTHLELANINSPGQVVLAGKASDIDTFTKESEGWKIKELAVSAPFHCHLMQPAQDKLTPLLNDISFSNPQFPIYQNVDGQISATPEEIREKLIQQVTGSVRWVDSVRNLIAEHSPTDAYEFGPGKVLSGLLKRIDRGVPAQTFGLVSELSSGDE